MKTGSKIELRYVDDDGQRAHDEFEAMSLQFVLDQNGDWVVVRLDRVGCDPVRLRMDPTTAQRLATALLDATGP
jgi:hypothetical protein